jgi:predicted nucleotidyltransferase
MVTLPNKVKASVDELIRQLKANNFTIRKAYIFGSYAKGQQTEWSDIDLALVSDQFEGIRFYDHCKISPYLIKVDASLEVHPFSPEDFTPDNPFVEEIMETGVRIV